MIRRYLIAVMTIVLLQWPVMLAADAGAPPLKAPSGETILTISGQISRFNAPKEARFDLEMIKALGAKHLRTRTCCSKKVSDWKGVLVRDLLAAVGAEGESLMAHGLDGYQAEVPIADFYKFDVIIAFEENGKPLRVRTRGPLRFIYPHDQHEELHDPKYVSRYVWQIRKIVVK